MRAPVDHVAAGLARQRPVYRSPSGDALLTVWLAPLQEVSTVILQLVAFRELGIRGSGYALDDYGLKIGVRREGREDPAYLLAILARVGLINSDGLPEDLLRLLRAVLPKIPGAQARKRRLQPATVDLEIGDQPVTLEQLRQIHDVLQPAAAAGVRLVVRGSSVLDAQTFRFGPVICTAAASGSGASVLTISPNERLPWTTGWCHPAGSGVIAWTRTAPGTLALATPLVTSVSIRQEIPITDAAGAPAVVAAGWGVGLWGGSVG